MRLTILLLSLAVGAGPAAAQSVAVESPADPEVIHVAPALRDPATADRLADAMQSLSQALLDLHVGRIKAALDGRTATSAIDDVTVRDLARRHDPDFDRHLRQSIAAARPAMEQGIRALDQALPEINHDLAQAHKSLERAIANLPDPNYPNR